MEICMKNVIYVKIKTFILIFALINMILQPVCIYFYLVNKTDPMTIIQHVIAGIFLTLSVSIIINEFIFRIIFYGMLKGKIITNSSNRFIFVVYSLSLMILFVYWFLFFIFKSNDFIYPISVMLMAVMIDVKNPFIISNGYLLCGFKIIPLDSIQWYKVSRKGRYLRLFIKYQGNKCFSTLNEANCIDELSRYFETHNILQKYNQRVS